MEQIPVPTFEGLIGWLEGHEPDAVVGRTGTDRNCPVVHYLRSLGYTNVTVGSGSYSSYSGTFDGQWVTRCWREPRLGRAMFEIDIIHPTTRWPVTAREVLEAIRTA